MRPWFALALAPALLAQSQEDVARAAVNEALAGDHGALMSRFADELRPQIPPGVFEQSFAAIRMQYGRCAAEDAKPLAEQAGMYLFGAACDNGRLGIRVVLNGENRLLGLRVAPPPPDPEELAVISGAIRLPAKLTAPMAGRGPFPAVVLVHGSGPQDEDETIGPVKFFRDIADGLSARGIASLRYVKRTRMYPPADPSKFTVEQETVEDAVNAAALLRTQADIDPKRIYLIGHSLGGYLAPRIAKRDPALRGVVVLAGNTRPIPVLIEEQIKYVGAAPEMAEQLKRAAPESYWKDLESYDPVAAAKSIAAPMLILQGERDYQVTMADFAGWRSGLGKSDRVTLKSYPKLNHLFREGEGKSTPAEYARGGAMAEYVLDDISAWIKRGALR